MTEEEEVAAEIFAEGIRRAEEGLPPLTTEEVNEIIRKFYDVRGR